ncbi:MMPL family transporter [Mycolicibacterium rutilum]|nr:MMPL family transporter [Mycolicibacterium rutilum]
MSDVLGRLGWLCATHPWRVIAGWIAIVGIGFGLVATIGGLPEDDLDVPGMPATIGNEFLTRSFPEMADTNARVVVHSPDGEVPPAELNTLRVQLADVRGVSMVSPPRMSADGHTALIQLTYDVPAGAFRGSEGVDALREAVAPIERGGLQVEFGGQVAENVNSFGLAGELVGVVAAVCILLFAFGSIVAAGLPVATALIGVGTGYALVLILAGFTNVSTSAPSIAAMVGVGVGIDYALLLVTRFREYLPHSSGVPDAAARANGSAGVSVVFAGTMVLVSLLALRLGGIPLFATYGYATFFVVGAVMLASITLVPALCGLARWAQVVTNRPVAWGMGALIVLLLCAAPMIDMRTWPRDAASQPTSNTVRRAYDLVASSFGPGANAPFTIGVDATQVSDDQLHQTIADLRSADDVVLVSEPLFNADRTASVFTVEPATAPSDGATVDTLHRVRYAVPGGMYATGMTPYFADASERLAQRLWLVIIVVVGLAVALLTIAFRAPVVALKAAVMNLLAAAATFGVLVAVFQWGWGVGLLGLPGAVPISSWVPILVFTMLFGLSMDYEVFILSRVREEWLATKDPRQSVIRGLDSTARVITSAALIMIAVFLGFAADGDITVKMMGFGMAVAVFIDVTIIRMILVPATMALLGRFNWWLPGRLDSPAGLLAETGTAERRTPERGLVDTSP